jgi:hypothetical protein
MRAYDTDGAAAPNAQIPEFGVAPVLARNPDAGKRGTANTERLADQALQKEVATLTARAALLGLVLLPLADGRWRMFAGARSTDCASLQAVAGLLHGREMLKGELAMLSGTGGAA